MILKPKIYFFTFEIIVSILNLTIHEIVQTTEKKIKGRKEDGL
jgi:hypothetical protein